MSNLRLTLPDTEEELRRLEDFLFSKGFRWHNALKGISENGKRREWEYFKSKELQTGIRFLVGDSRKWLYLASIIFSSGKEIIPYKEFMGDYQIIGRGLSESIKL